MVIIFNALIFDLDFTRADLILIARRIFSVYTYIP